MKTFFGNAATRKRLKRVAFITRWIMCALRNGKYVILQKEAAKHIAVCGGINALFTKAKKTPAWRRHILLFFIPPKPAIGNKKYCAPLNTFYGFQNFLMWRDKSASESKADFP